MPTIVSRREFLRLAALTGGGAAIAACAPAAVPTQAPAEPAAEQPEAEAAPVLPRRQRRSSSSCWPKTGVKSTTN